MLSELLSEHGAGVALRIAPCRGSSVLTAVGAWEVRIVVELGVLRMYAISGIYTVFDRATVLPTHPSYSDHHIGKNRSPFITND